MDKKEKQLKVYWQPELATSIVYWSYTLLLGCLALIIQLELIRVNRYTIILGTASLIFLLVGARRYLILSGKQIITYPLLKKNRHIINIPYIEKVDFFKYSITITCVDRAPITFIMMKKQQEKLLKSLSHSPYFQGQLNRKDMG